MTNEELFNKLTPVPFSYFYEGMRIIDNQFDIGTVINITKEGNVLIDFDTIRSVNLTDIEAEPEDYKEYQEFKTIMKHNRNYIVMMDFGRRYYGLDKVKPLERRIKDTKIARKMNPTYKEEGKWLIVN